MKEKKVTCGPANLQQRGMGGGVTLVVEGEGKRATLMYVQVGGEH